ncbi:5'-nucleotidase [Mesotoga sp. HF07.pep.5.2.highcov]|uniref:bifunctional 2',3'-cyclic-nucleotide 2'-phosphodiesterase/3'-nucleotidase n=1 Tax=Mesotoga sp. HF07.pep.5.2.highcov TaxID=1462923 RepID=UPI000FEF9105|nr:bifunctional 2',3'-cyclic-nucleotide 2'-phosphodiesterase/3'-nucleotidase [Mesotoga sp. HF07.pep.5.2.highcov]RLL91874.1 5'-nucleotidase [Mesotoga sp. HF07.pep.5.2.highcov]
MELLNWKKGIPAVAIVLFVAALVPVVAFGTVTVHELVVLGTTDLHGYVMPYDYLTVKEVSDYGAAKTFTLIKWAREMYNNTILIDTGDAIQGSVLAEREARIDPIKMGDTPSIIKAMNIMDYDVVGIGNHEFNFGLEYLDLAIASADFPMISANLYNEDTKELRYDPYVILEREVDGIPIKIGVIAFLPPEIMMWDRVLLEGKVYAEPIVDAAAKYVPKLREEGVDLVIVSLHQGSSDAEAILENVEGIDGIIMGHSHGKIADKIDGVPVTMAGSWGSSLGLIHFHLLNRDGEWEVFSSCPQLWHVDEKVEAAPEIVEAVKEQHEATIDYVMAPVGTTAVPIKGYFSRVIDNEVTQLVNEAQLWYVKEYFKGTEYESMPLLSAAAPFRTNTSVDAGDVRIMNAADIYIYSNTLHVVRVNGLELKGWLEKCAENFNQIDPNSTEEQNLLARFSSYNFDIIEGINYQIDVRNPVGQRIVNLTYEGEEVEDDMEFLVVTNNYRAGGGGYHLVDADIVLSSTVENRSVIIDYIIEKGTINPTPSFNWSIVPFESAGKITFSSSDEAATLPEELGIKGIKYIGDRVFEVDLIELAENVPHAVAN